MPQLHTLLHLYLAPIVVINGSSCRLGFSNQRLRSRFALRGNEEFVVAPRVQSLPSKYEWESTHPEVGFLLRCFQQLSAPHLATQRLPWARQLVHQRCVLPGPLVLGKGPLNALAPAPDMDRTVSRRSEPSSRTGANSPTLGTYYRPRWRRADILASAVPLLSEKLVSSKVECPRSSSLGECPSSEVRVCNITIAAILDHWLPKMAWAMRMKRSLKGVTDSRRAAAGLGSAGGNSCRGAGGWGSARAPCSTPPPRAARKTKKRRSKYAYHNLIAVFSPFR
jgi:hypothetical protein